MTRKTIRGLGVSFPTSHGPHAASIAPETGNNQFTRITWEALPAELPANEIIVPSLDSCIQKDSLHNNNNMSERHLVRPGRLNPPGSPLDLVFSPIVIPPETPLICASTTVHGSLSTIRTAAPSTTDTSNMASKFNINEFPPFQDPMETLGTQPYDVLRIKNVPYAVTSAEIKTFVTRLTNSPLIKEHENGYPIHIIMERSTAKTMDCYVEFRNRNTAQSIVRKAEENMFQGRVLRMGPRHITLELSNEGELCAALFPRAKSVFWAPETGIPQVVVNRDPFSEGFQGFFTVEEINNVCKHARDPQKSTFSLRSPQRVYECMISTLYKFPWHVPLHYSVNARNFIWTSYMEMLHILVEKVKPGHQSGGREVGLGHTLLMDFVFAGLNVQMFSLRQKFMIVHAAGASLTSFPIPRQAIGWPFQTLIPNKKYDPDVVDNWLHILDIGYEKATSDNIRHEYGQWLQVHRDDANYLKIEVSEAGRALPFAKLISYEKGVMEFLVEQGRLEWCAEIGVHYEPLNMFGTSYKDLDDQFVTSKQSVSASLSYLHPQAKTNNVDDTQHGGKKDCAKTVATSHFNPRTPSFIPTDPWNTTGGASNGLISTAPQQRFSHNSRLSRALTPSWSTPQELPVSTRRALSVQQTGTAASEVQPAYDPFSNGASPLAARRTLSNPIDNSSTPVSLSNRFARSVSMTDHAQVGSANGHTGFGPPGAPQPVFSSIWGPPVSDSSPAASTPRRVTPTELPGGGGSDMSPLPPPGSGPKADAGVANGNGFRSPARGIRSRSSTGHKNIYIQATINEEDD